MEELTNPRQSDRRTAIYDLIYYERLNSSTAAKLAAKRAAEQKRKRVVKWSA